LKNAIQLLNEFGLYQPTVNINLLPENSFFCPILNSHLRDHFTVEDDEQFYIIDNPISKESVFKGSYACGQVGWAGALKSAIVKSNY